MQRRLYPLNALRAFETSARHLSFVLAAEELHVTPAAISHQVKRLEEYLRVRLFQRLSHGLLLTDAGKLLLPELRAVFKDLDTAMERVIEPDSSALTINAAPVFAVKWLLPRLPSFCASFPDIDIRLSSSLWLVDFQRQSVDAAIRLGRGQYSELESIELFDESVTPMCTSRLLNGPHPIEEPEDLCSAVLLHDDSMAFDPGAPTWQAWLAAAGAPTASAERGPRFGQPDHALQAAAAGMGVALGWRHMASEDVRAGRLIEPFDLALPLGSSFYVVYPAAHSRRPKVAAFRDWLLEESKRA